MTKKEIGYAALYPATLSPGMTLVLPGSTLPSMMAAFGLDKPTAGLISGGFFFGALVGMLVVSDLVRKFGARATTVGASLGLAFLLATLSLAPGFNALLAMFVLIGTIFGMSINLPGIIVSGSKNANAGATMNLVYSFFALGVTLTPIATSFILDRGGAWWMPFLLPVLPLLYTATLIWIRGVPPMRKPLGISAELLKRLAGGNYVFFGASFCILLYVATEASIGFWTPKYLVDAFPGRIDVGKASQSLSWFWGGLTVGRLVAARLLKKIPSWLFVAISAATGSVVVAVFPHLASPAAMTIAICVSGFCYGGLYPTIVGYSSKLGEEIAPAAFSLITAAGQIGAMALPTLIGFATGSMPFSFAMSLIAVPLLGLAISVTILKKQRVFD